MGRQESARETLRQRLQGDGAELALRSLLEASGVAASASAWEFALRWPRLRDDGLSPTSARLMLLGGYLMQRLETTGEDDPARTFRAVQNLTLEDRCCLLLTDAGVALVRSLLEETPAGEPAKDRVANGEIVRPHWSEGTGLLRWRGQPVRRVPRFAVNLRVALACLQEDGWPPEGVDNPLPARKKGDVQRLVETVNYLNQHQLQARIEFGVDDGRTRLLWRIPPLETVPRNGQAAGGRRRRKK